MFIKAIADVYCQQYCLYNTVIGSLCILCVKVIRVEAILKMYCIDVSDMVITVVSFINTVSMNCEWQMKDMTYEYINSSEYLRNDCVVNCGTHFIYNT